jgi:hypothetical protein
MGYLDFQMQQWEQSIPSDLQLHPEHPRSEAEEQSPTLRRLRILLYIRGNQMRTLIHRHNVLSATNIIKNVPGAHLVTDIAKDTIRVLVDLNKTSDIYRAQQNVFNYFLVSALAALFLAVCHAPAEFNHTCRTEFYDALDLLKNFSARSSVSRRLWKSVRTLKLVAPRLGLVANEDSTPSGNGLHRRDAGPNLPASSSSPHLRVLNNKFQTSPSTLQIYPHNTHTRAPPSAATTTTTATSTSTYFPDYTGTGWLLEPSGSTIPAPSVSIPDMSQMSHDLTSLFEAFGNSTSSPGRNEGGEAAIQTGYEGWYETFLPDGGNEIAKLFEGFM